MNLELCSKEYHSFLENSPAFYEHLILKIGLAFTQITVPSLPFGRTKTFLKQKGTQERFLNAAMKHVEKILKNPKSSIGKLEINIYHWDECLITELFRHLHTTRKMLLIVRNISLASTMLAPNLSPGLLEYLEPGTLRTISLTNTGSFSTADLSPLAGTQQWEMAEKLEVNKCFMRLPYKNWAHFEFDNIHLISLSVETARGIMEVTFALPGS